MSDTIRYFRSQASNSFFPDGIVRIVDGHRVNRDPIVEYIDPPDGFGGHRFHVAAGELSRIVSPLFDVGQLWLITHPDLPSFYLNGAVQGILNHQHAAKIASDITGREIDARWNVERLTDIIT